MWRIATVSVALAGVLTATAAAADRTGEERTVVTAGALTVSAQPTTTGGYCLDVTRMGATITDTLCPEPSALGLRTLRGTDATVFFGAVPASVRRVDVTAGRRTVELPTVAADGFGGVRFYARAVSGAPRVGAVTARTASGAARAKDVDRFALPRLGRRWTAATVRDERTRPAKVDVVATRVLRGHGTGRTAALCTRLGGRGEVCAPKRLGIELRYSASCDTGREVVYGLAPAFVRKATALLEGGGRRAVTVKRVPRNVGRSGSVLVAEIPKGHVQRVLAYDGAGARVGSATLSTGDC
jgi:hypothetical protein